MNEKGIKVISESFVRPKHEVEAAKKPYYLGPLDLAFLSLDPIQKGLLFHFKSNSTRTEIHSLVERLKLSLSLALDHFYPLAGRFETKKFEDEDACSIFLDCIKGPGARLLHASMDLTVSDILSSVDVHPAVRSFFDLGEKMVNYDGHTKALLSVQVTELLDGLFTGFTMNHSLVDGTSFIHFVSVLSEIFRSDMDLGEEKPVKISREPIYKMFAPDGCGPIFKLPNHERKDFVRNYDPGTLRERIFHFSPESMARIKAKANEQNNEAQDQEVSSFIALSSLVWRSIIKDSNVSGHGKTSCFIVVNARTRLDPPMSDNYFGNFITRASSVCTVDELLGQTLGSNARVLTREVKKQTAEEIYGLLKMLAVAEHYLVPQPGSDQQQFYGAEHNVVIGGSHRFDMYGPEFGLGRAVAVLMGYGNKENGKVTANPGSEGKGSVDLEICLKPEIMSALEADEEFMQFVSVDQIMYSSAK